MEQIAAGRTARIFRLDTGAVWKRYEQAVARETVEREVAAMALARARGLPVPEPGPAERRDGRWGLTMPFVAGLNGMQRLMAGLDGEEDGAIALARLQARVHACDGAGLTDYKDLLAAAIRAADPLTPSERAAVLEVLAGLPSGNSLLHGDFHPGNLIWSDDGPVMVDWVMAGYGHPAADIARSLTLFGYGLSGPDTHPRFETAYLGALDTDLTDLDGWLLVQRAARLSESAERYPERVAEAVRARIE